MTSLNFIRMKLFCRSLSTSEFHNYESNYIITKFPDLYPSLSFFLSFLSLSELREREREREEMVL